jgi:hypothetical protein
VKNHLKSFEKFADENPDILLPTNLDVNYYLTTTHIADRNGQIECLRQGNSFKESRNDTEPGTPAGPVDNPETSPLWIEVVMRGKNRTKTRSRIDKITLDDRRFLEY